MEFDYHEDHRFLHPVTRPSTTPPELATILLPKEDEFREIFYVLFYSWLIYYEFVNDGAVNSGQSIKDRGLWDICVLDVAAKP